MARPTVHVDVDTRQMKRAMRAIPGEIRGKALQRATDKAAEVVRSEAADRAPVGRRQELKDNIIKEERETGTDLVAQTGIGPDREHFYGIYPEIGTVEQSAQPYFRPAHDTNQKEVQSIVEAMVVRKIREVEAVFGRDLL